MVARQEPTLRGQMDGALTWPIFTPSPLYQDLFPQRSTTPVTADIQSLKGHGVADAVIDRWAQSLPGLNSLQQAVINDTGLLAIGNPGCANLRSWRRVRPKNLCSDQE